MNSKKTLFSLNIKAVGSWNPRIIQPEWLVRLISPEKQLNERVEVLFNVTTRDLGYVIKNVTIFPRSFELEILIQEKDINLETQEFAVEIFSKIIKSLSHTPIKGIGFNVNYEFGYDEKNEITSWLNKNRIDSKNAKIEQYRFAENKKDYKLNIIIELLEKIRVNFNFHYKINIRDFSLDLFSKLISETEEYI